MIRVAAILLLLSAKAYAHDWYDPACCNDNDCAPVDAEVVRATDRGWLVQIVPGAHPLAHKAIEVVLPYDHRNVRRSRDGRFHLCIGPETNTLYCLYVPDMAF